ncbi:MAG TPA: hypothetical protein VGS57_09890 [Thermoanaerobaculia bacterium]|nr:hypothetical protein [Thermoanaerobaculia bacterium]
MLLVVAVVAAVETTGVALGNTLTIQTSGVAIWATNVAKDTAYALLAKADDETRNSFPESAKMLPLHHPVVIIRSTNLSAAGSVYDYPVVLWLGHTDPWSPSHNPMINPRADGYDIDFAPVMGDTLVTGPLDVAGLSSLPDLDALTKGAAGSVPRKFDTYLLGTDLAKLEDRIGGRWTVRGGKLEPYSPLTCSDGSGGVIVPKWIESCFKADGTCTSLGASPWKATMLYEGLQTSYTFGQDSVNLVLTSFEQSMGKPVRTLTIRLYAQNSKVTVRLVSAPTSDILDLPPDHITLDSADHLLLGYRIADNKKLGPYCYPEIDPGSGCVLAGKPFCPGGFLP